MPHQIADNTSTVLNMIVILLVFASLTTAEPKDEWNHRHIRHQQPHYFKQSFMLDCDNIEIAIVERGDVPFFGKQCVDANVITLINHKILPIDDMDGDMIRILTNGRKLNMCIRIEGSTVEFLDFGKMKSITGQCGGPPIVIVGNPNLKTITFSDDFIKSAEPSSVVIRGNPNLDRLNLYKMKESFPWYAIDLQDPEECMIPRPFTSFEPLKNCSFSYGVMEVTKPIPRKNSSYKFYMDGCIMISSSNIQSASFLDDIEGFTSTEGLCSHGIVNNSKLCIPELDKMRRKFVGSIIDQTANPDCQATCDGGQVTEHYLNMMDGCRIIKGDLILSPVGFSYGTPKNMDMLKSVVLIKGSLIVVGTTLEKLDEFSKLETIKVPLHSDMPAIKIVGNANLTSLAFPKLKEVYSTNNTRIFIDYNPQLNLAESEEKNLIRAAGEAHVHIVDKKSRGFNMLLILAPLMLVVLLLVGLIIAKKMKQKGLTAKSTRKTPGKSQRSEASTSKHDSKSVGK